LAPPVNGKARVAKRRVIPLWELAFGIEPWLAEFIKVRLDLERKEVLAGK